MTRFTVTVVNAFRRLTASLLDLPLFRMRFTRHIGIDHSGAQTPECPIPDEHNACCVAAWLAEMEQLGRLDTFFIPPLSRPKLRRSRLEGWILGVC